MVNLTKRTIAGTGFASVAVGGLIYALGGEEPDLFWAFLFLQVGSLVAAAGVILLIFALVSHVTQPATSLPHPQTETNPHSGSLPEMDTI